MNHIGGMINAKEFKLSCLYLIDTWAIHCKDFPPWRWQEYKGCSLLGEGYLILENVPFHCARTSEECFHVTDLNENDPETVAPSIIESCFFNYHVVYNEMFRVPKLFLRARYHDGRLLDCQEVQNLLPVGSHEETGNWTFLTYEEHPFLHVPWLALHPCGTSELMSTIFTGTRLGSSAVANDNKHGGHNHGVSLNDEALTSRQYSNTYMLTWLSFVSPAIALKLPRGFSKCFFK